jgi:hypothetical protein
MKYYLNYAIQGSFGSDRRDVLFRIDDRLFHFDGTASGFTNTRPCIGITYEIFIDDFVKNMDQIISITYITNNVTLAAYLTMNGLYKSLAVTVTISDSSLILQYVKDQRTMEHIKINLLDYVDLLTLLKEIK